MGGIGTFGKSGATVMSETTGTRGGMTGLMLLRGLRRGTATGHLCL